MQLTSIDWAECSWNPLRGCTRISPGCGGANHEGGCYAEKMAARFSGPGQPFHGLAKRDVHGGHWTGKIELAKHKLSEPINLLKSRLIFVNSMSDLFHEKVLDEWINRIFDVMERADWHIYQILTKRSPRMMQYLQARYAERSAPPHLWFGVSCEDQPRANERISHLRETPAEIRFISFEPVIGPIDKLDLRGIRWAIVGSESGPRARLCDLAWMRSLRDQCQAAGIPVFVKQVTERGRKLPIDRWPEDLRVRQFPQVHARVANVGS